ncbi:hypothetical protein [Leisingera daeponensis]|uniref:hypothetical protein n=1 Tax=Leisingera daeponensis TaxID=405746 RepID=UPI001C965B01|nr:hypothetical protein [Leisingera daeponensis]MBY6055406.1 hypothetical protein [Leisingera daeponensis]
MARIAIRCEQELGLKVRQVFDLQEVAEILKGLEKGYLSPILDPAKNDFTPANSFWLVAENETGPVMAGGVRCDDLRDVDVKTYWNNHLVRTFGIEPRQNGLSFPIDVLQGRVAYFGDLKSTNAIGLSKAGRSKLRFFTAIGHYLTCQEFRPDVTYCFIQEADAMRGTPSNYGFLQLQPFFYSWDRQPYPSGKPEWVASLRRSDVPQLMASVERLIEESADSKSEREASRLHLSPS